MNDLIEALGIFSKYALPEYPTQCAHDTLYVNVDPALVSEADRARLEELGFFVAGEEAGGFTSFRFGSC